MVNNPQARYWPGQAGLRGCRARAAGWAGEVAVGSPLGTASLHTGRPDNLARRPGAGPDPRTTPLRCWPIRNKRKSGRPTGYRKRGTSTAEMPNRLLQLLLYPRCHDHRTGSAGTSPLGRLHERLDQPAAVHIGIAPPSMIPPWCAPSAPGLGARRLSILVSVQQPLSGCLRARASRTVPAPRALPPVAAQVAGAVIAALSCEHDLWRA
jgi:hypothetical protein